MLELTVTRGSASERAPLSRLHPTLPRRHVVSPVRARRRRRALSTERALAPPPDGARSTTTTEGSGEGNERKDTEGCRSATRTTQPACVRLPLVACPTAFRPCVVRSPRHEGWSASSDEGARRAPSVPRWRARARTGGNLRAPCVTRGAERSQTARSAVRVHAR